MSLSTQSINEVAKKRTRRARVNVEKAETQLKVANQILEKAIPSGDTDEIKDAHIETQRAEVAVASATEDLQVVEALLDEKVAVEQGAHTGSGEGVKSLLKLLKNIQP